MTNNAVDLLIRPQLPCAADLEALIELQKLNGHVMSFHSEKCEEVNGLERCITGPKAISSNNAHTVPLQDATSLPLTTYLVALGLLPNCPHARREFKNQLWNQWSAAAAAAVADDDDNFSSNSLIFFPTDLMGIYETIVDYLRKVELIHDSNIPWIWDWNALRGKVPARSVLRRRASLFSMWVLPNTDGIQISFKNLDGKRGTCSIASEQSLVPASWTVNTNREEHYKMPNLPKRWLFLDPFITLLRSVQDLSQNKSLYIFTPEAIQIFNQLKALARLMEIPFPSAYREQSMVELLQNVGFNTYVNPDTPINKAPRVFSFPTEDIAHYNRGQFYIPSLSDKHGVDDTQGTKSELFTYLPKYKGVERTKNEKLVVDVHTDELWRKITAEAHRDGMDSKAVSKRLAELLERAGDFVQDGEKQSHQLREESMAFQWNLFSASYGEGDLPALRELVDEVGRLI